MLHLGLIELDRGVHLGFLFLLNYYLYSFFIKHSFLLLYRWEERRPLCLKHTFSTTWPPLENLLLQLLMLLSSFYQLLLNYKCTLFVLEAQKLNYIFIDEVGTLIHLLNPFSFSGNEIYFASQFLFLSYWTLFVFCFIFLLNIDLLIICIIAYDEFCAFICETIDIFLGSHFIFLLLDVVHI